MSVFSKMLAKVGFAGITETIKVGGNVLDNLFTSKEEKMEAERLMKEIEQKPDAAQWEINKIEAQHRNWWVAGWRPAIGWVCAGSLFSYYIPQFVLGSIIWTKECWAAGKLVEYPLSIEGLMGLVMSLLGMGTLRTIEKFGKVNSK